MLSPLNDDDELTYLDTHVHIFVQIFFLILVSEKVYKKAKWEAATLDHSIPPWALQMTLWAPCAVTQWPHAPMCLWACRSPKGKKYLDREANKKRETLAQVTCHSVFPRANI